MKGPTKIADAGKEAGKKVLATDTAQGVVEAVVDKLEEITVDKADDVAATVKDRAAKAGGRSPKRSTAKKSSAKKSRPRSLGQEVDGQEEGDLEEDAREEALTPYRVVRAARTSGRTTR